MKSILTVVLLVLAFNASAACPVKRPGDAPVIPDGAVASGEEIYQAQRQAEKYLLQAEAYMACGVMNRRQHEAMAVRLEALSEQFDEEFIEYRVRSNMVARK